MTDKKQNADTDAIKAKMREALDRKKPHDSVEHAEHRKEKGAQTHGPVSGGQMYRRKDGGS